MGYPSSGKNQGKLRTNQSQLTLAQDDERRRKFRVPGFVAGNQADVSAQASAFALGSKGWLTDRRHLSGLPRRSWESSRAVSWLLLVAITGYKH